MAHGPTPSGRATSSSKREKAAGEAALAPGATATNGGPWSDKEHRLLLRLCEKYGARDWPAKAEALGTGRTSKAVECRWRRHAEFPIENGRKSTAESKKKQKSGATGSNGPVAAKSTKFARIQDGDVSRAVTKSGRVHLSRYQATAAGVVIQPRFDPKRDWEPDEREEIIAAVNAAFHAQKLPQSYTSQVSNPHLLPSSSPNPHLILTESCTESRLVAEERDLQMGDPAARLRAAELGRRPPSAWRAASCCRAWT